MLSPNFASKCLRMKWKGFKTDIWGDLGPFLVVFSPQKVFFGQTLTPPFEPLPMVREFFCYKSIFLDIKKKIYLRNERSRTSRSFPQVPNPNPNPQLTNPNPNPILTLTLYSSVNEEYQWHLWFQFPGNCSGVKKWWKRYHLRKMFHLFAFITIPIP